MRFIRFTREGLVFYYHGDRILRRWPWLHKRVGKFRSSHYSRDFDDFDGYVQYVEMTDPMSVRYTDKLQGYSWRELLTDWVKILYPNENVVVLVNVNASAKGVAFWSRLPKTKVEKLLNDVVVLRCKSPKEVELLVESVTPEFADAYGFSASGVFISNLDKEEG